MRLEGPSAGLHSLPFWFKRKLEVPAGSPSRVLALEPQKFSDAASVGTATDVVHDNFYQDQINQLVHRQLPSKRGIAILPDAMLDQHRHGIEQTDAQTMTKNFREAQPFARGEPMS